jgi:eukaryotic-like serine/threonine-protein kinase
MSPKVTITVIDSSFQQQPFEYIQKTKCSIGRSDTCTITIPNEGVSREHCLLEIDPPHVQIKKLADTTTTLNGIAIGKEFQSVMFSGEAGECLILGKDKIQLRIELTGNRPVDVVMDVMENIIDGGKKVVHTIFSGLKTAKRAIANNKTAKTIIDPILYFAGVQAREPSDPNMDSSEFPRSFDGYTFHKLIGQGGGGSVYLSSNTKGKNLAIKTMLFDRKPSTSQERRFVREIDNVKSFNHHNIVRFIDHGIFEGHYYHVMEYCEAGSLTRWIECMGGKLPLDSARSIIFQVLDGLEYLHTVEFRARTEDEGFVTVNGIVHRDLKPSNILLKVEDSKLVAKIGDFGLSKSFEIAGRSGLTSIDRSGAGSYRFLCRRQLLHYRDSKPEVDIWATAACLYYMLSGNYPRNFSDNVSAETNVLEQPNIPIQQRNPDVPNSIAEVIDRALSEDTQNDRALHYQSVSAFRQDLLSAFDNI